AGPAPYDVYYRPRTRGGPGPPAPTEMEALMFAVLSPARKVMCRLMLIFSAVWLAACQPVAMGGGGSQTINPSEAVPVALLVPHGSGNAGEAALARDLEAAARMAVADLQGVRIDL